MESLCWMQLFLTYSAKQQAIQNIIDNLQISTLEYRNESDPDVSPYVHNRKIELIEVWTSISLLKFVVGITVFSNEIKIFCGCC